MSASWSPFNPTRLGIDQVGSPSPAQETTAGQENFLTSFVSFMYGSDAEGRIILQDGEPIWRSATGMTWIEPAVAYNSNRPAGYFMVNTGDPTRDAIMTIVVNEVGVDNFRRAADYVGDQRYIAAAREFAFGVAEAGLMLTGGGKLIQAIPRIPRGFKAARAAAGQRRVANKFTPNQPGGFLNRSRTALFGGQYVDPAGPVGRARTRFVNGQRVTTPGGPIVQTRPNALAAVAQRYRNDGFFKGVVGGTVRSTAKAIRSGVGAAFPKGRRLGRASLIAAPLAIMGIGTSRMNQAQAEAAEGVDAGPGGGDDSIFDNINTELAEATANAQQNSAGIQAQYNAIFRELQGMYNLAETEEEKERLRFMLADIEAQRDAGLEAIATGYADTAGKIRERAVRTQAEGQERAQMYSDQLTQQAEAAQQRLIDQQAAQVAANRGLGLGTSNPMNEWIGFMNTLPAIQQQYTGRMADITAEGQQWMADTLGAQSLAQQGDLQRLAAATRSGTIASHQQQVGDRIAREQAEMRDALMRLSMAGLSASQTQTQGLDGLALREYLASLGASAYSDSAVTNYLSPLIGRQLTPDEMAIAQYERSRIPMTSVPDAAGIPVGP